MSFAGMGVVDILPYVDTDNPFFESHDFIPKRFEIGGRLKLKDAEIIYRTRAITCVLCGGLILNGQSTFEHPIPQWLMKYAGGSSEYQPGNFRSFENLDPTWRQICLKSHELCNSTFAKKIENPAIKAVKCIVEGKTLTNQQIDALFDWFDKVKSTIVHVLTALEGHTKVYSLDDVAFANRRVGLFDRKISIFKVDRDQPFLGIRECDNEKFGSTPSAISIKIFNVVMVYSSYNLMLSKEFGLGKIVRSQYGNYFQDGIGKFPNNISSSSIISGAIVLAQPMRGWYFRQGLVEKHTSLKSDGQGKVFQLIGNKWIPVKSIDFSKTKTLNYIEGYILASIEVLESIIDAKIIDDYNYTTTKREFLKSLPSLIAEKESLERELFAYRASLRIR